MAKKKPTGRKPAKRTSAAAATAAESESLKVDKDKVGATVQAMISFEGATQVEVAQFDATKFLVTRTA